MRTQTFATLTLAALFCGCNASHDARFVSPPDVADASAPTPSPASNAGAFSRTTTGAFVASYPQQHWTARIDATGAALTNDDGAWRCSLHVARIGRAGAMHDAAHGDPIAHVDRVERRLVDGTTEWCAPTERGVEHGINIAARPEGTGALVIEVETAGLLAVVAGGRDETSIALRDATGHTVLRYAELAVRDADGRSVAATMRTRGAAATTIELRLDDSGARFPLVVDPLILGEEQAKLVASDGAALSSFGMSVALDGAIAIVGANEASIGASAGQGAAYVFTESAGAWTQQAKLVASDGAAGDNLGRGVAIRGTTALVGADLKTVSGNAQQGAAYVFAQSGTTWVQQAKLVASGGVTGDFFAASVALSGTTALLSAEAKAIGGSATQGAAYVFAQAGAGLWKQQSMLTASDGGANDRFGSSVALDGSRALIGASDATVAGSALQGAAYVFERAGTAWTQHAKLLAADAAPYDSFGTSVALSGSIALVGAYNKNVGPSASQGVAYVFAESGGAWTEQAELIASDGSADDAFGSAVALSGTTALVGAPRATTGGHATQGAVYVFVRNGTAWTPQVKIVAPDGAALDGLGSALALQGTTAIASAPTKDVGTFTGQGAAYVFVPGHSNGDACTSVGDCVSGLCVDGVCCNRACTDSCEACDVAGARGTCSPTQGAPHGGRAPCVGTGVGTACGPSCNGIDPTQCIYALATTGCGTNSCAATTETHTGSCDFHGNCISVTKTCGAFACGPSACNTTCATSADCAPGFHCASATCEPLDGLGKSCTDASSCVAGLSCTDGVCCAVAACGAGSSCALASAPGQCRKKLGTPCAAAGECDSNVCADGVCCNSRCTGQCSACDAKGVEGTCTLIVGAPHGVRAACPVASAGEPCSAAICDGISATTCAGFASSSIACRPGSCSGNRSTPAANCDGRGHCPGPLDIDCGAFACTAATGGCLSTCTADPDCAQGNRCVNGACLSGAACVDVHTSRSPAGVSADCSPYLCATGGECAIACSRSEDCVGGFICDPTSNRCVSNTVGSSTTGSRCAWSPPTHAGRGGAFALALATWFGSRRTRRTRRRTRAGDARTR